MNSEDASTIALAPFVRFFTYAIIRSMRMKNFPEITPKIHADMVPKLSHRTMMASLGQRQHNPERLPANKTSPKQGNIHTQKIDIPKKPLQPLPPRHEIKNSHAIQTSRGPNRQIQKFEPPQSPPQAPRVQMPIPPAPPRKVPLQDNENTLEQSLPPMPSNMEQPMGPPSPNPMNQELLPPTPRMQQEPPMMIQGPSQMTPQEEGLSQFYGKITQLLNDPSVSIIECSGMGQPVMVIRRGQRQPTKIVLSEKEITQVLEKVSEAAHIPILEGVFRAAVDNFSINAVISEMIGSRFVIKKIPSQMNAPMY